MKKYLDSLLDVRREELPLLLPLFSNYLLLILASYILRSASSGLFLSKLGIGGLPHAYILTAIAATLVAYCLGRLAARVAITRLIVATEWFLVGNMLLLWWMLQFTDWIWPYYAFLIWIKIFSMLTVALFWIYANNVFNPRQAKRLFGLLNLGGVVGATLGGTFAMLFAHALLAENLLLCAAAVMILAIAIFWLAARRSPLVPAANRAKDFADFPALGRLAFRNQHLLSLTALIAITTIVGKLVEFQFFGIAKTTYTNKEDLTAFLGGFLGLYLNAVTFPVQFFLTGTVLRTLGVGGALRLSPAAVAAGAVGVLAFPSIWTASFLRMVEAGFRYSLNKTSLEVLYLPIPSEIKNRTKIFIDMVVDSLSGGLGGLLLVLCTSVLLLDVRQIGIVILIFSIAWFLLGGFALSAYVGTVRKSLEKRTVDFQRATINVSDAATIGVLQQALDSPNERQVTYALQLLQQVPEAGLEDRLPRLFQHPSPAVRANTLRLLAGRGDPSAIPAAQQFVAQPDPALRVQALHYLCRFDPEPDAKLQAFLNDADLSVRLAALQAAEEYSYVRPLPSLSLAWMQELLGRSGPEGAMARAVVAHALPLADPRLVPVPNLLARLLEDSDPLVRQEALKAAGKIQSEELVPLLLRDLAKRSTRAEARESLVAYGPRIVRTLGKYLANPNEPEAVRQAIPKLLGQVATAEAAETLVAQLPHSSLEMRFQILKALNRIRRDHPEVRIPGDVIDREIFEEAKFYYRLLSSVQSDQPDGGPGRKLLIGTLEERLDQTLERIFRLLGLRYPLKEVYDAYQEIRSRRSRQRNEALEFLDNVLDRSHKRVLLPLLEESSWERLQPLGKELFGLEPLNMERCLRELIRSSDRWVKIVALNRAAELQLRSLEPEIRTAQTDPDRTVVETATLALGRLASPAR